MKSRWHGSLLILLLAGLYYTFVMLDHKTPGHGATQPAPLAPANEMVYSAQLPNGLHLLVEPDHSSPVVSIQAWVGCGSITENEYLGAGISHILEHMLFKGTSRRGNSEIAHTIHGLGGDLNAYTSFDCTVFHTDLPSDGWKTALDVISDAIFNATLPVDEYTKEQEVIRREFAMGKDDPNRELHKLLFETSFVVHPYRYPVIGHLEIYNRLTRDDVLKYYKRNYVPDNVTFIVAGDVDPKEVEKELATLTASVKRTSHADVFIPSEPRQIARREAHLPFPTDTTRIALGYHIPGVTHHDIYALDLLSIIAGQGSSSRLQQELVEKKQLLRAVSAFAYTPAESGIWGVSAVLLPEQNSNRDAVTNEILGILNRFTKEPVSIEELEKAKRQAIVARASELKTVSGKAASLGNGWLAAHDIQFGENYLRELQKVTIEDIQRVAKHYFTDDNLTVTSLDPVSQPIAAAKPQASSPSPKVPSNQPEVVKLASGPSLVMVSDKKVPLVTVRLVGLGGVLSETPENNGISRLTAHMLGLSTHKRSAEQIASEIENLGGNFESESANNSFTVAVEVLDKDLERAVELLADMSLNPAFNEDEIDREKEKMLADLKLEFDSPLRIGMNAFKKLLFNSHPYSLNPLGTEKTLHSISRNDLLAYHKTIVNSGNIVFSISGSFDPAQAKSLFDKYFSALPNGTSIPRDFKPTPPTAPKDEVITSKKQQAVIAVGVNSIALDHPDRAALDILDEALSGLGSRLFIRIRERQSLAYYVSSSQFLGFDTGAFFIYAGVKPEMADKARSEMEDELHVIAKNGLAKDEIERARAKLIGQRLLQNQSAGSRGYKAALNLLYKLGINFDDVLNEKIKSIPMDEVNNTVRKYLTNPNYISVTVQPNK